VRKQRVKMLTVRGAKAAAPSPDAEAWAQIIRNAAAERIKPDTIGEIFDAIAKKAMKGDAKSAAFLFDFLTTPPPAAGCKTPACDVALMETRRRVARYLMKNGPATEETLVELFGIDAESYGKVFVHSWFARCNGGFAITSLGRKENE
jgi:hypothetical protein